MRNIHQSVCSFIPPHIQRHVAEHGSDRDRKNVATTQFHTSVIAQQREHTLTAKRGAVPRETKTRKIYDAQHAQFLPGNLVFTESSRRAPTTDIEVREAFDGSGDAYDFFDRVFGRKSIDGRGMPLISTVHYGKGYDNAMWNGKQMVYGDGDGKLFIRFTGAVDVTGHEFTHGMTQFTAALPYHGQGGALNEHISDVAGIMIKQRRLGLTSAMSDWLIGKGLFGPSVQGKAIRSMAAPGTAYDDPILGKDPQPAHMRDYVNSPDDNGGVHINSGIPNHAFFLAATRLGGYAWEVAGDLWYEAATERITSSAEFQDFANATVMVAGVVLSDLWSPIADVQRTIADAWAEVGIVVPAGPALLTARLKPAGSKKWRDRPASASRR